MPYFCIKIFLDFQKLAIGTCNKLFNTLFEPTLYTSEVWGAYDTVKCDKWEQNPLEITLITIISRWSFGSQPSVVIAHVLNKNVVSRQTRNSRKLPKHKLSQNAKKKMFTQVWAYRR